MRGHDKDTMKKRSSGLSLLNSTKVNPDDACQAYTDSPMKKWSTAERRKKNLAKRSTAVEVRINTGNDITVEGEDHEILEADE